MQMTDLILANQYNLPANLEDLAKFVLIGRDKLQAVRAEINAISKLDIAREVREQKLHEAQEIGALVLLAEAKCGELFNKMPKAKENQYTKSATSSRRETAKLEIANELGFNKNQVSQFQKLADNPEIVRETIQQAKRNDEIPTRSSALNNIAAAKFDNCVQPDFKKPHIAFNSGNNEWYTPKEFIDAARNVMGNIDLDPASNEIANKIVQAEKFYSIEDDGLAQEWRGNIWLNPPYASGLIDKFVDKLCASDFEQAIVLVNNATDTKWFLKLVENATAIVFTTGRVRFYMPDGSTGAPLQGQAVLYFGESAEKFIQCFKNFGWSATL